MNKSDKTKYILISLSLIILGVLFFITNIEAHTRELTSIVFGSAMFVGTGILVLILTIRTKLIKN